MAAQSAAKLDTIWGDALRSQIVDLDNVTTRLILGDAYAQNIAALVGAPAGDVAIVVDPPYAFQASGGGHFRKARPNGMDAIHAARLGGGFDPVILDPAVAANVVVFCCDQQLADLIAWLRPRWDRVAVLVWPKANPLPFANKSHRSDVEFILHAWMKDVHPAGSLTDLSRVYRDAPSRKTDDPPRIHPTQKPVSLLRRLIRIMPARTIVDPSMGAGSTGVAALREGRRFVGVERDGTWFAGAEAAIVAELAKASVKNDSFTRASSVTDLDALAPERTR